MISDEVRNAFYLSEMAQNNILSFNLETGSYQRSADFKKRGIEMIQVDIAGNLYTYKDSLMFGTLNLKTGTIEGCMAAERVPAADPTVKLPSYMGAFMGGMSVTTLHDRVYMHALRYNDTLYRYHREDRVLIPEMLLSHKDKFRDEKGVLITVLAISDKMVLVKLSDLEFLKENGVQTGMMSKDGALLWINREDHSVKPIRATYLSREMPVKLSNPFTRYGGMALDHRLYAKAMEAYQMKSNIEKTLERSDLAEKDRNYLQQLADGLTEESNPVVITGRRRAW